MRIKLLYDKLLIEPLFETSSIIIPQEVNAQCKKGKIVALGQGIYIKEKDLLIDWELKVGDIVYFKTDYLDYITIEGKKYLLLSYNDLLAYEPVCSNHHANKKVKGSKKSGRNSSKKLT